MSPFIKSFTLNRGSNGPCCLVFVMDPIFVFPPQDSSAFVDESGDVETFIQRIQKKNDLIGSN